MAHHSEILLAALLHDIGKFYQRADPMNSYQKSEILSDSSKRMEGVVRHKHVLWTNEFITKQENVFNQLLQNQAQKKRIYHLALHHHNPLNFEEALFALADRMASGMDRTQKSNAEHTEKDYERFKKTPLVPIFENLIINDSNPHQQESKWGYRLHPLCLEDDKVFPQQQKLSQNDYKSLWKAFEDEWSLLPTNNLDVFNELFLTLLKKYTWCIPASTIDFPNNSLYDHTKMVAAMAVCLFAYHAENPIDENLNNSGTIRLPNDIYPFLFLNVELTGIQSFLFNINSNKAARALKGRSFYLNLLIDTVKERILHDLGLSSAHVVYASGGKCYFLLPNTTDVKTKLNNLESEIVHELHKDRAIGDELYICFGRQAFGMSYQKGGYTFEYNLKDIGDNKSLGDLWKAVGVNASANKTQKYKSLLISKFTDFFSPQGGGDSKVCALTGLFFDDDKDKVDLESLFQHYSATKQKEVNEDDEYLRYVKKSVAEQVKIGKNLQTAEYILTSVGSIDNQQQEQLRRIPDYTQPLDLGVHVFIYSEKDTERATLLKQMPDPVKYTYRIQSLNEYSFNLPPLLKDIKGIAEPKLYGGNRQAMDDRERLMDYELLAESTDNDSFARLGVLRMDVDSLGQIFIKGFPQDQASFSALATLSSMLDWFFSGYLNTIRNQDTYKNHVNILYSGGDDVFAIGKWDKILSFAEEIRNKFREFVCNREDISISAGVALVKPKFPILKAALIAGDYEDTAKDYNKAHAYNGKQGPDFSLERLAIQTAEKNAICIFGIAVCWDKEWNWVKEMKDKLVGWLEDKSLSRAVLHKIQRFYDQSLSPQNITWRWHAAYYIGRQRSDNNLEAMDFLEKLWLNDTYRNINLGNRALTLLTVAARWAELETRAKTKIS